MIESLLALIPEDRRIALANGLELPDRTNGSVLFADISGFTPLTATLALELGVYRGAEEVLNQINPVYEAIIAELHRYGGSVLGFAGDSITCWLDGDRGERGVACALAMQEAMRPFSTVQTPAGTSISLAIKVAVAAGPARRFVVGDPDIQLIDVLAGRTLDHVAAAEKLAEKGEVIASEEIIGAIDGGALSDDYEVVEWRTAPAGERYAVVGSLRRLSEPTRQIDVFTGTLSSEQARAWTLPPVYNRLLSGSKFLAELRPSIALFLKFSGIDYDHDDDAQQQLDRFVRWMQAIVQAQGGFLIQLTIGDKGSYAYFSFGAPVAHDDDSLRAVAAAIDLLRTPPELSYISGIQIGISRGRVWAGECGARSRHTYGVMGNEVNMAARLMSHAQPGQILVRRRVADETRQVFQFRQLGLIAVKGGAEPIPVAELLGRQSAQESHGSLFEMPLAGRTNELEQLGRMLDGVLTGRGRLVTLQGPTGIGKSHLISVFRQYAGANGFQTVTGSSQRIFQSTTYYPWQQIIRQIFGLNERVAGAEGEIDAADQIATLESILTQMNQDWQIRLPLLGDLLGLPIPDNPTTAAFDPKQRQESLFAFVVEILRAWSHSQPLLLVFENAHWLDEPSHNLLEVLAKATSDVAIMVVAVTRPLVEDDPQLPLLTSFGRLENHQQIRLGELDSVGIQRLLEDLLGGPVSLLARLLIEAKAQGNPFFAHELVDTLRESGQLLSEDGTWVLSSEMIDTMRRANIPVQDEETWDPAKSADLSSINLGIPDSVHGVILARIDRLPESHKPTLKVASVIGYSFDLGLVSRVHPLKPSGRLLRAQVNDLETRDFIAQDWQGHDGGEPATFVFRQQAIQEVSYETLLFTQRRELHGNLARLLEELTPEAVGQIAYHAFLGEDWERALRYHLIAGNQNKQLFANLQSIDHFRKALASAEQFPAEETLGRRQEIHANLGELLVNSGQNDAGQEHLLTAFALAGQTGDSEAQASACRWMAKAYEMRGQYEPALEWIDKGLTILGDRLTPSAIELRLISGLIFSRLGDNKRSEQQGLASLQAAEGLGQPRIVARAHNLLGVLDRNRGLANDAVAHFEQAIALYEGLEDLHGRAITQNLIANAYFDMGQWTEADRYYRQAGHIFRQLGIVYDTIFVDNNLGGIALSQGRFDDALQFLGRALKALEQIGGSLWVMGALHLNLGAVNIRGGEIALAFEHLRKSQELFNRAKTRDLLPEMHRRFAEAYLAQSEFSHAREEIAQSLVIAEELDVIGEQGLTLHVMGVIAAAEGLPAEAEQDFEKAIRLLSDVGDNYGLACAQLSLAELSGYEREDSRRQKLLGECLPIFERLGAQVELERARGLL